MYKGTRKTLPICIYPIKYLNEPLLPYEYLLDNTVRLVDSTFIDTTPPKIETFCSIFLLCKEEETIIFYAFFSLVFFFVLF